LENQNDHTQVYALEEDTINQVESTLRQVTLALQETGYSPVDQMVGYLISGDPTYITSHHNARTLIRQMGRDRILDELVRKYLESGGN
jgi:uncharacterized protein (UPF0297 family)